jgi:phage terminase large subunit
VGVVLDPALPAIAVEQAGVSSVVYRMLPHQQRLHESTAPYVLIEGGRGGGKSICLRWDAYLRCLLTPRFRAILVRRSMPELRMSHLNEVPHELTKLGLDPKAWHATDFMLRFPNGSSLRFGHAEDDATLTRYLSSEFEWLGIDEAATFTQRQFAFMCTSLRSPIDGYIPLVRLATNPVGPGAGWVKRLFIDKNPTYDEMPDYAAADFARISCNMDQNPFVNQRDYEKKLNNLPSEALRKALRYGEWVVEGQFFSEWAETREGRPWHVIDALPTWKGRPIVEAPHIQIVRVVDWGYSRAGNPGVCLWIACLTDGSAIVFDELVFRELLPSEAAELIERRSTALHVRYTIGDPAMWQEHEGPSIAEHFENCGIGMIEADKQRVAGWVTLHTWLRDTRSEFRNGTDVTYPRLRVLRSGCPHLIRTFPTMVIDPRDPQDVQTVGVEDDAADCLRYFAQDRGGPSRVPRPTSEGSWMMRELRRRERKNHQWAPAVLRGG